MNLTDQMTPLDRGLTRKNAVRDPGDGAVALCVLHLDLQKAAVL